MHSSTKASSCVHFSNAWLPLWRAGEDRHVWVNLGMGIYKTGVIAGHRDEEAGFSFLFFFLKILFIYFRQRGREREREEKKCQCLIASCVPPTGEPELAHNPGTCPDWESNWHPFGSQARAQCTEPDQPGQKLGFLGRVVDVIDRGIWAGEEENEARKD